jgi:hypothetical protein
MAAAPETFVTKMAADRWLAKKRTELDAGTAVDDLAGQRALEYWWQAYRRSIEARKARTVKAYDAAWRLRVAPRFGTVSVRRIRPGTIDEWVADMLENGVSGSKVVEAVGVLNAYSTGQFETRQFQRILALPVASLFRDARSKLGLF